MVSDVKGEDSRNEFERRQRYEAGEIRESRRG